MHYCFLSTGTWAGNASFVRLREFGNELLKRGHRVSFVLDDVPYNRDELKLPEGAALHFVPPGGFLKQAFARRGVIRTLRADYVHVLNPYIKAFLALAIMPGQKVVGDWDEWPAMRPHALHRRIREKFLDRWQRRRSSVLVVASRYLQEQFRKRFGLEAAYIPYATYLQPWTDGASPFAEPAAVYMGNLYPAYDHDLLINAAVILRDRGLTPKITLLGGGPDLEKWRQFTRDNGIENVTLPGYTSGEELWRHLRHARLLLLPIRENILNLCRCPSKTYAYAQARRPIVANHVGEVVEVLKDHAAYVAQTPEAFAEAIATILEKPTAPDVDYQVEAQNWSARTDALLAALGKR